MSTRLLIIMLAVIAIAMLAISVVQTFSWEEPQQATTTAAPVTGTGVRTTGETRVVAHMDQLPKSAWEFYRANFSWQDLKKGWANELTLGQGAGYDKFESIYGESSGTVHLYCPRTTLKWTAEELKRLDIAPKTRILYHGGLIPTKDPVQAMASPSGAVEFVAYELPGEKVFLKTSAPVQSPVLIPVKGLPRTYRVDFSKQNGAKIYDDCAVCDVLDERVIEKTYH